MSCKVFSSDRKYVKTTIDTDDVIYSLKVHAYISKLRNCNGGQGNQCTENEPCYPCELEKLAVNIYFEYYIFLMHYNLY